MIAIIIQNIQNIICPCRPRTQSYCAIIIIIAIIIIVLGPPLPHQPPPPQHLLMIIIITIMIIIPLVVKRNQVLVVAVGKVNNSSNNNGTRRQRWHPRQLQWPRPPPRWRTKLKLLLVRWPASKSTSKRPLRRQRTCVRSSEASSQKIINLRYAKASSLYASSVRMSIISSSRLKRSTIWTWIKSVRATEPITRNCREFSDCRRRKAMPGSKTAKKSSMVRRPSS